jgi:hypothetical protein
LLLGLVALAVVAGACGSGGTAVIPLASVTPAISSPTTSITPATDTPGSLAPGIVQRHDAPMPVPPATTIYAGAKCGAGEQMVGGGYVISGGAANAFASYPSSQESWTAGVSNPSAAPLLLTAFVDCLQGSIDVNAMISHGAPVSIAVGTDAQAAALCPTGTILTDGGFLINPAPTGYAAWSTPGTAESRTDGVGGNDWLVQAVATATGMMTTAYAVCAGQHLSALVPHPRSILAITAGAHATGVAACPLANQLVTGGGFVDTTTPHGVAFDMDSPAFPADPSPGPIAQWHVSGTNTSGAAHSEFVYVICVTVSG